MESRGAQDGERKTITALFADIKGSVEMMEGLDPEEARAIVDPALQLMMDAVHRYEGYVAQSRGDGIFALFGAPIAQEDHARRALYAALRMQEEIRRYSDRLRIEKGVPLQIRVGLNSGEMVVRSIRKDDLHTDYVPIGHSVNLAARMEGLATPGSIAVSEDTHRLTRGYFRFRELGPAQVKGVSEPVRIYELEGVGPMRTHLDVARSRGLSRFVGRQKELEALEAALSRALEGNGQIVGVVGDPGLGKSRLCYEFVESARARGVAVNQAHGMAHGKTVPFLPVLEIQRDYFGITEQDGDRAAREKIAGRLLLLDREFESALPLVFDFLGVPDPERPPPRATGQEDRQADLFRYLKRLAHAHTRREPWIIVLEDLHWWDPGSLAFVDNQAEIVAGSRVLMLVNFRPEYHASWMQKSYYEQLPLLPLDPRAIGEMLRDLVGNDVSRSALGERIRERTGGNPFFIEEVVQSLMETGSLVGTRGSYRLARPIEQTSIPATVQAVLAARIDRLGEREKTVLQTASVIGKEFSEPILKRVCDLSEANLAASLATLGAAEFLYEKAIYPEAEYAFKHPLTQEVAYGSQLAERRSRVHGAVARAIEEFAGDKLDERAALLAHHCENAGEPLKAALWHGRAGDWAGMNAAADAFRHWTKVLTLLEGIPLSAATIELALEARARILTFSWSHGGLSAEQSAALLQEGRDLATRTGSETALAKLLFSHGTARYVAAGETLESLGPLEESVALADRTGDLGLRIATRFALYQNYFLLGRIPEALQLNATAVELAGTNLTLPEGLLGFTMSWAGYGVRGWILIEAGRLGEAAEAVGRSREIARRFGETVVLSWTEFMATQLCERLGDAPAALRHARQSMELAERTGSSLASGAAQYASGIAFLMNGLADEAAKSLGLVIGSIRDSGTSGMFEADAVAVLACAELAQGDADRAHETATVALEMARRRGMRLAECRALFALAASLQTLRGAAAHAEVESILDEAAALVRNTGARAREPLIRLARAELARVIGDDVSRRSELREAHRLFLEIGAPIRAAEVAKELGLATAS